MTDFISWAFRVPVIAVWGLHITADDLLWWWQYHKILLTQAYAQMHDGRNWTITQFKVLNGLIPQKPKFSLHFGLLWILHRMLHVNSQFHLISHMAFAFATIWWSINCSSLSDIPFALLYLYLSIFTPSYCESHHALFAKLLFWVMLWFVWQWWITMVHQLQVPLLSYVCRVSISHHTHYNPQTSHQCICIQV